MDKTEMYLLLKSLLEAANWVVIVSVSEAREGADLIGVRDHCRRRSRSHEWWTSWPHRTKWMKRRTGVKPTHYDTLGIVFYSGTQNNSTYSAACTLQPGQS